MIKKFIAMALVACAAIIGTGAAYGQFRYGVTAGADLNSTRFKQKLFDVHSRAGAAAGVTGEMIFPGVGVGIDLGVQWMMRSSQLDLGDRLMWHDQGYGDVNFTQQYVAIPLHLRLKWQKLNGFEDKVAPIVYAGPSFAFNAGHTKLDAFQFAEGDVSIDVGIGAEFFKHWQLLLGYTFGATYSMEAKMLTNFSNRWNSWQMRVAYYF